LFLVIFSICTSPALTSAPTSLVSKASIPDEPVELIGRDYGMVGFARKEGPEKLEKLLNFGIVGNSGTHGSVMLCFKPISNRIPLKVLQKRSAASTLPYIGIMFSYT
jgi:hypothetical protein